MSTPFSNNNHWRPGRSSRADFDPQNDLYTKWAEEHSDRLICADAERLDVAGARDLLDRMVAEHPGVELSMRVGSIGNISSPGCFRPATKEVLLPSAEEKRDWFLSQGGARAPKEKLETYRQEVVIEAFSAALVHATYCQGERGCAPHDPEALGAYAYALGRYFEAPGAQTVDEVFADWMSTAKVEGDPLTESQIFEAQFLGIDVESFESKLLKSMMFDGHLAVRAFDRSEWAFLNS